MCAKAERAEGSGEQSSLILMERLVCETLPSVLCRCGLVSFSRRPVKWGFSPFSPVRLWGPEGQRSALSVQDVQWGRAARVCAAITRGPGSHTHAGRFEEKDETQKTWGQTHGWNPDLLTPLLASCFADCVPLLPSQFRSSILRKVS